MLSLKSLAVATLVLSLAAPAMSQDTTTDQTKPEVRKEKPVKPGEQPGRPGPASRARRWSGPGTTAGPPPRSPESSARTGDKGPGNSRGTRGQGRPRSRAAGKPPKDDKDHPRDGKGPRPGNEGNQGN
jgi:hypothetical protein